MKLSESFELNQGLRGRSNSYKSGIPKLRSNSNAGLNISGSSSTTECSILKNQDSISITGKPPRVPILKTNQTKIKDKTDPIFVEIDDEKYYISEYR
jgi:hypothetical protein